MLLTQVYLDYAATTPVDPRVIDVMMRHLGADGVFANPASLAHAHGLHANQAVRTAREQVAALIGAEPPEIIWTSGATEAINLALKGALQLYKNRGHHIITWKTEHKAVLDTCQYLEKTGFTVTYLKPLPSGLIDFADFKQALRDDTVLVTVMHINNEIGVIQDIDAIAAITAERGILLHVDAAQSVGKIALDVARTPVDLMSLSAHKIYGPKGIGALYVRRKPRVRVAPLIHGGGQELGMRSGTLPTHQIVGMGAALAFAGESMHADQQHITYLRTRFLAQLAGCNFQLNGDVTQSWPGIINLCFPGHDAKILMQKLPALSLAIGSACTNNSIEPSYVLRALGLSTELAQSALRISLGRFTTADEVDFAAKKMRDVLIGEN